MKAARGMNDAHSVEHTACDRLLTSTRGIDGGVREIGEVSEVELVGVRSGSDEVAVVVGEGALWEALGGN